MELFPIFFGGLFFIGCAIGGLVYSVVIAKGKGRWRGLLIGAVGLIGLIPLLMVVPPPFMSLSSLSGTYEGDLGGEHETLVLHRNGTFDQSSDDGSGVIHKNRGTWSIDDIQRGSLDFTHLYLPEVLGRTDPEDFSGASVHRVNEAIYFSEDEDIYVRRVR